MGRSESSARTASTQVSCMRITQRVGLRGSLGRMSSDAELAALAARVGQWLLRSRRRLVTAESCTGGFIAKTLTDIPGSSQWFECGYVTYSNEAKARDLSVTSSTVR